MFFQALKKCLVKTYDLKSSLNVSPNHWLNRNYNIPRVKDSINRVRIGLRALNGRETYYKLALQQVEKEVREEIKKHEDKGTSLFWKTQEKIII